MAHYAAWLARRWHDPIFPRNWPQFGTEETWERETVDLEEQRIVVDRVEPAAIAAGREPGEDEAARAHQQGPLLGLGRQLT